MAELQVWAPGGSVAPLQPEVPMKALGRDRRVAALFTVSRRRVAAIAIRKRSLGLSRSDEWRGEVESICQRMDRSAQRVALALRLDLVV